MGNAILLRMKANRFLWAALLVLISGLGIFLAGFKGSANLAAGWPLRTFAFKIAGEAHGFFPIAGLASLFAAFVLVLLALAHQVMEKKP